MPKTTPLLLGPIIGGLTDTHVNLWGRASSPATLHAWLGQKADFSDAKLAGRSLPLSTDDGFAGVVPLDELNPETTYFYALTLGNEKPSKPDGRFRTFPAPAQPRTFSFALGSCFRPEERDSGEVFDVIERRRQAENLRFILMIGDQIYADARKNNGLMNRIAVSKDDYRKVYEHTWSKRPLRGLLKNLPAFMTLDDHEVDDDWRWRDAERRWATIPLWDTFSRWLGGCSWQERHLPVERVRNALQAYWEHQGMHAPPPIQTLGLDENRQYHLRREDKGSLAYTFEYGAAAFFVMDTRTMRVRGTRPNEKTMLGKGQWQALEAWLLDVKDKYPLKFIVTSASVLHPLWLDIARDRWSGFQEERTRLLSMLALHGIEGVYFLAGDLHAAHVVSAELYGPQGKRIPVWEFCSSPFEQKPNWVSKLAYTRIHSGPITNQQRRFCVAAHNFGIVHVDFSNPQQPQVRFVVHYRKKEGWKTKPPL